MRIFVITGLALFLQACVGTPNRDMTGKTLFLPESQIEDVPAEFVSEPNESRPQVDKSHQKIYAFRIALVPYVMPNWARIAEYENSNLKLTLGDEIVIEIKLDHPQSQRLNRVIETFDEDAWSGFYVCDDVLDGDIVGCRVDRGDEVLEFRGSNGSPKGFSALLSEIDAIVQKDFFPDYWIARERNSKQYEDEDDLIRPLQEQHDGEHGGERQPTTDLDSKAEGNKKPKQQSDGRSQ